MESIFNLTLCLSTLFSLASCAVNSRTAAKEKESKRSPDYRFNKEFISEFKRQYVRDRN